MVQIRLPGRPGARRRHARTQARIPDFAIEGHADRWHGFAMSRNRAPGASILDWTPHSKPGQARLLVHTCWRTVHASSAYFFLIQIPAAQSAFKQLCRPSFDTLRVIQLCLIHIESRRQMAVADTRGEK